MMTNDEIMIKAGKIAEGFFYSDGDKTPWQPFEDYSDEWITRQIDDLQQSIYHTFKGKL
jgi:hypothetical protein